MIVTKFYISFAGREARFSRQVDTIILDDSALGGSTPGAPFFKSIILDAFNQNLEIFSLPALGHYEDTDGREVHFSAHLLSMVERYQE